MAKADLTRDYYADLELPPTADVNDIKKQFRKLALKYHPDRNPGRESEVNHKFQVIQSAHEILTNPEQKSRYDSHRSRTTRYPTASGVRGNPWQDAGNQWAPPPTRRPANTARPSATASRYASWAQPPNQKSPREVPPEHAKAWDRMRPGASTRPGQNPTGASAYQANSHKTAKPAAPPVPPRTEAGRKKAEASFGNRRTNFSQTVPDEPPAPSNNYSSARKPGNIFADAAAQAQTRPVPPRPQPAAQTQQSRPVPTRPVPDPVDPLSQQFQETFVDGRQRTPYSAHGGEKFNPFDGTGAGRGKSVKDNLRTGQTPTSSQPSSPRQRRRSASVPDEADNINQGSRGPFSRAGDRYTPREKFGAPNPQFPGTKPNAPANGARGAGNGDSTAKGSNNPNVFAFSVDDDVFTPTSQQQQRFTRKSADSINTRFVADEFSGSDWQFSAGSANEDAFLAAKQRHAKARQQGRQSPAKTPGLNSRQGTTTEPPPSSAEQPKSGFNPEQWSSDIGWGFIPQQPPRNHSASPVKTNRPIKKPKPVRKTAGTAGLVDEDETSSSEDKTRPPTAAADYAMPTPPATDSPVAMDIDTPPPEPAMPAAQPSVARNIPVEPSKPEWRAGNVNGVKVDAKTAAPTLPIDPNRMGSEDTDSFLGSNLFADFRNVTPFAPQIGGLGSLGDLASNLPFESKPAAKVTLQEVEKEPSSKPLAFPTCPKSPHPPPVLAISNLKPSPDAWKNYVRDFHVYMEQWADFNARVTDHFAARKAMVEESKKRTGFNWVESRDDAGIKKYLQWLEEDKVVRQKWMAACDGHELRVREFLKYKEKMLQ